MQSPSLEPEMVQSEEGCTEVLPLIRIREEHFHGPASLRDVFSVGLGSSVPRTSIVPLNRDGSAIRVKERLSRCLRSTVVQECHMAECGRGLWSCLAWLGLAFRDNDQLVFQLLQQRI